MKTKSIDLTNFKRMLEALGSMLRHRREKPVSKVELLYLELLQKYFWRVLQAQERGEPIIAHGIMFPTEIFYGLDLVPFCFHSGSSMIMFMLKNFEEVLDAAKAYGITAETCSGHICIPGIFVKGWAPKPDFIVWSNEPCDNAGLTGHVLMDLYDVPGIFLDRPYRNSAEEILYYTEQLAELVKILEERTGHQMDWARLSKAIELSTRFVELQEEIYQLKKNIPAPSRNRWSNEAMTIAWLWFGTPEGIEFLETIKEEMHNLLAQGKGFVAKERFRLSSIYTPPIFSFKLLDWLEREYGAVIVSDPDSSHWPRWQIDPARPLECLARRYSTIPCGPMQGPVDETWLPDAIQDAIDFKVDGAIFWANRGCRHGPAVIRSVMDALSEKANIPTIVIDCDLHDPTFVSEEDIRGKLEGFFEILEERHRTC
jgi:benzoyl-CoA reductase/2-hydroxyglutaryl-CoA dehydratase subunit BcrC/BadD/HgdB